MQRKGFTLIELLIVIALIAIIAAITIPGLLRSRTVANEGSAAAALRTIATSQVQFFEQGQVDQDDDGHGEFGLLGELAGTTPIRGNGHVANPTFIQNAMGPQVSANYHGSKSGYYFKIYLPGNAAVVTDSATNTEISANANRQELKWRAYAWPIAEKSTGNRAFAIDQGQEVFGCDNIDTATNKALWSGSVSPPPYDAAVNTGKSDTSQFTENCAAGMAAQGQSWTPTN